MQSVCTKLVFIVCVCVCVVNIWVSIYVNECLIIALFPLHTHFMYISLFFKRIYGVHNIYLCSWSQKQELKVVKLVYHNNICFGIHARTHMTEVEDDGGAVKKIGHSWIQTNTFFCWFISFVAFFFLTSSKFYYLLFRVLRFFSLQKNFKIEKEVETVLLSLQLTSDGSSNISKEPTK